VTNEPISVSANTTTMAVSLSRDVLFGYRRFSLYNSPYVAHEGGCAIDLYPEDNVAPSPVPGEVIDTQAVKAPPKPYAATHDHLVLVDTGTHVARLLHVKPWVEPGDTVATGEAVGDLVRAGFFAPWVSNHIHLGFREHGADLYRASGSLPIEVGVDPDPVPWDGTGTVAERGRTWARLDVPSHPDPGGRFAGLASDGGVLDGGFPHYDCGGLLGPGDSAVIAGTSVGTVSGRDVGWHDCTVRVSGKAVTGIALFCGRDTFGIKLVGEGIDLSVGETVAVEVACE
jgi:hypothetical protein